MSRKRPKPVTIGNWKSEKIYKNLKKEIKKAREEGYEIVIKPYKSKYETWNCPSILLDMAALNPEVKEIRFRGPNHYKEFLNNLDEHGYDDSTIEEFVNTTYKISSLQPLGIYSKPKQVPPSILGYPTDFLVEILDEEENDKKDLLKQMDTIEELSHTIDYQKNKKLYRLKKKGENIVKDYVEEQTKTEEFKRLVSGDVIPLNLLYIYMHPETLDFENEKVARCRPFEFSRFSENSLFAELIEDDNLDLERPSRDWIESESEIVRNVRAFWDELEDMDLAISSPYFGISTKDVTIEDQRERKEEVPGEREDFCERSIPVPLAEKIYDEIQDKVQEGILETLMLIHDNKDSPTKVKSAIENERSKKYDLEPVEIDDLRKLIGELSEEGITTNWSKSETPYLTEDEGLFMKWMRKHLLKDRILK